MRVWLTQIGEPHPTDGDVRLYRTGLLAEALADAGHEVRWWSSTFNHPRKIQRHTGDVSLPVRPGLRLEMLHAPGYRRNVGPARLAHHARIASKLARAFRHLAPPDVILASFPTPELVDAALTFGQDSGVPVVVDVRDLWPDTYLRAVPLAARNLGKQILARAYARNRRIFSSADSVVAISPEYLDWAQQQGRPPDLRARDRVIYLGYRRDEPPADLDDTALDSLRRRGVNLDRQLAVFVGTFGTSYDLPTVVEAGRILARSGRSDLQIVIAGDGEQAETLQRQARGLDTVVLPGWIDRRELFALTARAMVGIAPYRADVTQGLPNKPFEYLAAGLPMLSSLPGELEPILRDEEVGRQYPAGDADRLARLLGRLADDREGTAAMGARARSLFEARFSAAKVIPELVAHLESMSTSREPQRS